MNAPVFKVGDIGVVVSARGPLRFGVSARIERVEISGNGTPVYGVQRPDGIGLHWYVEGEIQRTPAEAA